MKQRWTQIRREFLATGMEESTFEQTALRLRRDDPEITPSGEGRDIDFTEFRRAFGGDRKATLNWIQWAERKHLLVRGARVQCSNCLSKQWLPMASLPPPVGCAGCGRMIAQPYDADQLKFRYRIGEPIRRVLETDSLGHIFALHWFTRLFGRAGLVGAHPGVTFTDLANQKDIGEADVTLLFADGEIVPIEVKRRPTGVDERTIDLMNVLADALDAPWDALAITKPARECEGIESRRRDLPSRPRFIVTNDQLLTDFVVWPMGADPFAWNPQNIDDEEGRRKAFVRAIRDGGLESKSDDMSTRLLNRELDR